MTRHAAGLRRAGQARSLLQGRKTSTITHQARAINFTVFYGISGAPLASQIPLWKELADDLLCVAKPFVVAGDWQRPPQDLRNSGICRLLDAVACAPDCATNLQSGSKIDYFLVSRTLVQGGWNIRPLHGCLFRPHVPIVLEITLQDEPAVMRRLVQPRLLPIEKPAAEQSPTIVIDWNRWKGPQEVSEALDQDKGNQVSAITRAAETWCAGAEAELLSAFGLAGQEDEPHYLGIGRPHKIIEERARSRYRDVSDSEGLLGHRLEWTLKSLNLARDLGDLIRAGVGRTSPLGKTDITVNTIDRHVDTLSRIGHRAMAFAREKPPRASGAVDAEACWPAVRRGLHLLAHLVRTTHRRRPLLLQWRQGQGEGNERKVDRLTDFDAAIAELTNLQARYMAEKRRKARRALRHWVATAEDHVGHRTTKASEATLVYSASSSKEHLGEPNPQAAADRGSQEWKPVWRATLEDTSDDIMDAIDHMEAELAEDTYPTIELPPFEPERLAYVARRVRASTSVGGDWLRLRHVAMLSKAALEALATWFTLVEQVARWPSQVRSVIEIALTKKGGGARLIGVGASLYRLWARVRYADVKMILEARLERPELAAAPRRGASQAAFEAAFTTEAATAKGQVAATSAVDMSKFFEYVQISEYAAAALRVGIPRPIVALTAHFYTGARRLRVQKAYSIPLFPRRSIVAGCTWCTVFIRVLMLAPLDNLRKQLKAWSRDWAVNFLLRIYIDDGMLTTYGHRHNVGLLHAWATKYLLEWINYVLRKMIAVPSFNASAPIAI